MAKHKHNKHYKHDNNAKYIPENKSKKFCLTASALIAAGLIGGYVYTSFIRNSLEDARENSSLRQRYLERLISKEDIPFSSGVIYDQDGNKLPDFLESILKKHNISRYEISAALFSAREITRCGEYDAKTPEVLDFNGERIKTPIFIGRKMFTGGYSEGEIINCIISHEGRHAEQIYTGLENLGYLKKDILLRDVKNGSIPQATLYRICELDAVNSELKAIEQGKIKVPSAYSQNLLEGYKRERLGISEMIKYSNGNLKILLENTLKLNPQR